MGTLSSAVNASASALSAERTRIEAAVSNLANAESTRSQNGQPYRRRDVILQAEPAAGSFSAAMASSGATGVRVARVVEDQSEFRRRYEPGHPDADADGFVSLPNVDAPMEMVDMLGAARAYQANLAAIGIIRDLVTKALDLGRG
jgi:flagellar basal-body rod protein FlgC